MYKVFLSLLLAAPTNIALADWASGGGILTKDANNPWFIQNTPVATYCIIRDADHFKIDEGEGVPLDTLVRNALQYWKDDYDSQTNGVQAKIATQNFLNVSNCEDADIRFQFGYLSPAQLEEMQKRHIDPQEYVSIAVRTDYDQLNLRGKGFVYLAADSGALRPNSKNIRPYPWAEYKGAVTYNVLVHELGHVFGIQHQGHNPEPEPDLDVDIAVNNVHLMAENYPEMLLDTRWAGRDPGFLLPSFFTYKEPPTSQAECTYYYQKSPHSFYYLNADDYCYTEEFRKIRYRNTLEVYTRSSSGVRTLAGSADLSQRESLKDLAVSVWLPSVQIVYPPQKKRVLHAAYRIHSYYKGEYRSVSGSVKREIFVLRSPIADWNRVGGVINGRALINIKRGY